MLIVHLWWYLQRLFGASNTSGVAYGFWSGSASDLGEITLIGMAIGLIRSHNCHVKGCWRTGKHQVDGTPYKVCKLHHPGMPTEDVTYAHVKLAHKHAMMNNDDSIRGLHRKPR